MTELAASLVFLLADILAAIVLGTWPQWGAARES